MAKWLYPLCLESLFCTLLGQWIPFVWPDDIPYWVAASLFLRLYNCLHRALSLPICKCSKFIPSAACRGVLCSPPVCLDKCLQAVCFLIVNPRNEVSFVGFLQFSLTWALTEAWPFPAWLPDLLRVLFCHAGFALQHTYPRQERVPSDLGYVCRGASSWPRSEVKHPFHSREALAFNCIVTRSSSINSPAILQAKGIITHWTDYILTSSKRWNVFVIIDESFDSTSMCFN